MMRSLYAGVSGLRAHQVRMDVIGNNIANVNTTAFKASRVIFSDLFSQTMLNGSRPTAQFGGTNSKQVGLGVNVASIDTIQTGGSMQLTGRVTDVAIQGNGFYVMKDGGKYLYTRAGNFDLDAEGNLVNPSTGQRVQGWMPDATTGLFPTKDVTTLTNLNIPIADAQLPKATTEVIFDQALNAASPLTTQHTAAYTVIDSLGKEHSLTLRFTKVANNTWDVQAFDPDGGALLLSQVYAAPSLPALVAGMGRLQFNADGSLQDHDADPDTPFQLDITFAPTNGANPVVAKLDFSKVIQPNLASDPDASSLRALDYDGYTTGTLTGISIATSGVITGFYSNGNFRDVGQLAIAAFANPGGLTKEGDNNWAESVNSGLALIGVAGEGGRGSVASNNLEMSNVDISAEFTNMIVTQRGFQANSRIITTSDELLQEIVNLKR